MAKRYNQARINPQFAKLEKYKKSKDGREPLKDQIKSKTAKAEPEPKPGSRSISFALPTRDNLKKLDDMNKENTEDIGQSINSPNGQMPQTTNPIPPQ